MIVLLCEQQIKAPIGGRGKLDYDYRALTSYYSPLEKYLRKTRYIETSSNYQVQFSVLIKSHMIKFMKQFSGFG